MCFKQAIWKPLVNAFATMCGLVVPIALAHAWCAFSLLVQEEVAALSRATPFRRTITCCESSAAMAACGARLHAKNMLPQSAGAHDARLRGLK